MKITAQDRAAWSSRVVPAVTPPREECQVGSHAQKSVEHQWRVEKEQDSLGENHGNSETEMSPAG